jgi:hypothetical protein
MRLVFAAATAAFICAASPALAHGIVGDRFFPATIATDDPFAADELALPTVSYQDGQTDASLDYAKSITGNLALSFGAAWSHTPGGDGFQNLDAGLKYVVHRDAEHQSMLSAGLDAEFGGTGAHHVGAERTTTLTPTFYFGRGWGDAPADWLKPLAVTGSVGYAIPARARDGGQDIPYRVEYGLAIEYSLRYFSANVHDEGWPEWVNQLTPIVEIALDQPVLHRGEERTTGNINPGVIWSGQHIQLGAEAIIPINSDSGHDVGFAVQLHYYLDDIFPHGVGRPLFGARS